MGIRIEDLLIVRLVLYRLSYGNTYVGVQPRNPDGIPPPLLILRSGHAHKMIQLF